MTGHRHFPSPRTTFRLLLAIELLMLTSCDSESDRVPVFPVRGELYFDGQPAEGAFIIFHPVSPTEPRTTNPNGRVQADGSFQLTTYESADGAPVGEYVATVFWPEPPKSPIDHPAMGPDRLGNRYINPETSTMQVTVNEGENILEPIRLSTEGSGQ